MFYDAEAIFKVVIDVQKGITRGNFSPYLSSRLIPWVT